MRSVHDRSEMAKQGSCGHNSRCHSFSGCVSAVSEVNGPVAHIIYPIYDARIVSPKGGDISVFALYMSIRGLLNDALFQE